MTRINAGDSIDHLSLKDIQGNEIEIPHDGRLTHLQFRRFAGCPMCNLHIRTFVERYDELRAAGINEVVVFHSKKSSLLKYQSEAPFTIIADPDRSLYRQFGVENSIRSLLHIDALQAAVKGMVSGRFGLPDWGESPLGLPADFLIGEDGRVIASKEGTHAYDHWTVEEVIDKANSSR